MASRREPQSLEGISLLADLSPHERDALARRCTWRRPRAGEQVVALGAESREVLFVVTGRLRVVYHAPSGREIAYAYIELGGHVGELGVIDGKPRSASVEADSDCLLAVLPSTVFLELLDDRPIVARRLLVHLAGVIRAVNQKAAEYGLVDAIHRVYRELLRLARPVPGGGSVVMPMPTQEELAALAATTRETAARALGQLAKSGVAVRRGRELIIRDPALLKALVTEGET
jgi:CRP/FNR family transcriptional regulator, cyclic AMP receptor protein